MDFKQAADDVRKLTRYFESLHSICEALDDIASIDQARSEAQARLQAVLSECSATQEQIAMQMDRLNEAKARVQEADAKAAAITDAAVKNANGIIDAAKAECDVERKRLASQADDAKRRENESLQHLNNVKSQIAVAQLELEQISLRIDEAKRIARAIAA